MDNWEVSQVNNQNTIPITDEVQLTLTLKMTTAQVVETLVTVNNKSHNQGYVHPDDQTQPTFNNDTNEVSRFFLVRFITEITLPIKYAPSLSPVFPI